MKAVIEREELLRGIGAVLDVVPSKTALPVLSNILVEAEESGELRLSATDLDISIICSLTCAVESPGSTTVPARKFAEIIREFPDSRVKVEAEESQVVFERERGADGRYALMSVPAEDFPELPANIEGPSMVFSEGSGDEETGGGDALCEMIRKTSFAVSRDETRPVLNGVLWQLGEGRMTMVATDGHRLVKCTRSLACQAPEAPTEAIVPPRALNHLVKLMGGTSRLSEVQFGQSHLLFTLESSGGGEEFASSPGSSRARTWTTSR